MRQPAVVNGVLFDPFGVNGNPTTVGNFSLSESPGTLSGNSNFGSTLPPFVALSPNYQTLLESAAFASIPVTLTLTMSDLSMGRNINSNGGRMTRRPRTTRPLRRQA